MYVRERQHPSLIRSINRPVDNAQSIERTRIRELFQHALPRTIQTQSLQIKQECMRTNRTQKADSVEFYAGIRS